MKIFNGLKLYPHGFLGLPQEYKEAHPKKPITVDIVGTATRSVTIESEDNLLMPNNLIMELYEKATSKELLVERDFGYREQLYQAALNAFGTVTINDWIMAQKACPYFDTRQQMFLEETVGFVFTGFRKYHVEFWMETMTIGDHNAWEIGPHFREHLLMDHQRPMLIREFVQQWLTRDTGLSDLLISLRVLFGS